MTGTLPNSMSALTAMLSGDYGRLTLCNNRFLGQAPVWLNTSRNFAYVTVPVSVAVAIRSMPVLVLAVLQAVIDPFEFTDNFGCMHWYYCCRLFFSDLYQCGQSSAYCTAGYACDDQSLSFVANACPNGR